MRFPKVTIPAGTSAIFPVNVEDIRYATAQLVACRRPLARILKVDSATGNVLVNLGSRNNLKQGTRFFIDHRGMFTDKDGNLRFTSDRAKTPLKTVEVYDSTALLSPIGTANGNVQIDDIAQIE